MHSPLMRKMAVYLRDKQVKLSHHTDLAIAVMHREAGVQGKMKCVIVHIVQVTLCVFHKPPILPG